MKRDIVDAAIKYIQRNSRRSFVFDLMERRFGVDNYANREFDDIVDEAFEITEVLDDYERLPLDKMVAVGVHVLIGMLCKELERDRDDMDDIEQEASDRDYDDFKELIEKYEDLRDRYEDIRDGGGRRGSRRRGRDDDRDDRGSRSRRRSSDRRDRDDRGGRRDRRSSRRDRDDDRRGSRRSRDSDRNSRRGESNATSLAAQAARERADKLNNGSYDYVDPESRRENFNANKGTVSDKPVHPNAAMNVSREKDVVDELTQKEIIAKYPIDDRPYKESIYQPGWNPRTHKAVWYVTDNHTRKMRLEALTEMEMKDHMFAMVKGQPSKTQVAMFEAEATELRSILLSDEVPTKTESILKARQRQEEEYKEKLNAYNEANLSDISDDEKAKLVVPIEPEEFEIKEGALVNAQTQPLSGFGQEHLSLAIMNRMMRAEDVINRPRIGYIATNELSVGAIAENSFERDLILETLTKLDVSGRTNITFEDIRKAMTDLVPMKQSELFSRLNARFTRIINDVLKHNLGLDGYIESFYDAIQGLPKDIVEAYGDATMELMNRYSPHMVQNMLCVISGENPDKLSDDLRERAILLSDINSAVWVKGTPMLLNVTEDVSDIFTVEADSNAVLFDILVRIEKCLKDSPVNKAALNFDLLFSDGSKITVYRNLWADQNLYTCKFA